RKVDAAVAARPFFQPVEVPEALQVGALLASEHRLQVAVRDAGRKQELHVDVLVELLWPGVRLCEPLLERLLTFARKLVQQLAAIPAVPDRPDEAVTLQALEGRIDLADIDFPGPTQHRLKAVLHLISVEGLHLQKAQDAVLKRQSAVYPY